MMMLDFKQKLKEAKIILYDDPTKGLEPITSKENILLMLSIQKKHHPSLLSMMLIVPASYHIE